MSEKFRLLLKKNPNEIKHGLSEILDLSSLDTIQKEINHNVLALFDLGLNHYDFAKSLDAKDWRHKISRFYYAAYNIARAVRLHSSGVYSVDSTDHKKVGELPDDFPDKEKYENDLPVLRDDRNMCDYDHISTLSNVKIGINETLTLVNEFIQTAKEYLRQRNVEI